MIWIKHIAFACSLLIIPFTLLSQQGGEYIIGLESMPLNANYKKSNQASLLQLPFYDDFSSGGTTPNPLIWEQGEHVYINTSYANDPLTIGVATFDALNSRGQLHSGASVFSFFADTLTSQPIDLFYPHDTTIYLSFWIQPKGLGNSPEPNDSLTLDFYNAQDSVWIRVWSASVNYSDSILYQTNHLRNTSQETYSDSLSYNFFPVMLPIAEQFRNQGFQFRIMNKASISDNSLFPGLRSNSDHWHVDLMYLNSGRRYNNVTINDVAISNPLTSVLNNYESIPWAHFNNQARSAELPSPLGLDISYTNLGIEGTTVTRTFFITDASNGDTERHSGGSETIEGEQSIKFTRYIQEYPFESAWSDSAHFTFTHTVTTGDAPDRRYLLSNDTVRYNQRFVNYYAYDDGTAEMGYGLYGEGAQHGMVALQFNTYKADSLVGVYMHFNQTFHEANKQFFILTIWNDNNGKPGDVIYDQLGTRVRYTDELNRFTLFRIDDPLWLEAGTYYVGWSQINSRMLNVGYDLNRVNNNKLFYRLGSTWHNSRFEGTLMIRPVFGYLTETPTSAPQQAIEEEFFSLYPNPTQGWVNISMQNSYLPSEVTVNVYNAMGQLVLSQPLASGGFDATSLPRGTYIVRILSSGRNYGTQKLVVQ